ncbi:MAG: hypothetical protein IH621_02690 [Krumholzibacteria bacterium]|nr:hypothetical protein [Candidatus Krumholzibacteria bacterium]
MDLLNPGTLPYVFLVIAAVFGISWLRHRGRPEARIAQRNRLRLAVIFAVCGGAQLLWRLLA